MATLSTFDPEKALNSTRWCMDFSLTKYDDWTTPLGIAAIYLVDIHTMQVMVQLLPVFVTNPPDYTIEDSYVYNCTAPILKSIFSCEPLVRVEWASCHLSKRNAKANKDKTNFKINKPEFAAVILV
ncbi:hypothetical protein DFQ28_007979 [Apophysomyces sp. BC1034]|nr:hypothetical protein DFQ28_007979 [Apophysomyces sp. BC1034]